ncbi:hypothetical protein [Maliponia aquimaris]|nr:hypothetical protein [Maliponia aquimaris]
MSVQDDRREEEQIELFELSRPSARSRDGIDAELEIDGITIEFELKSTTKSSMTTVRDFGMSHIEKWKDKHWLFGFYTSNGKALRFTRYASPRMMSSWIEEKRQYISMDFLLSVRAPGRLEIEDLFAICGQKDQYTIDDAKMLHKNQFSKEQYIKNFDLEGGYSPEKMLEILRLRCKYVLERGSTLNNPHIPANVLNNLPIITKDHSEELRRLVRQELKI